MDSLAVFLRQWRQEMGYTQQEMADLLVVHRTTYTKYETDVMNPPVELLCRMADLMDCTTDKLLGRE